MSQAANTWPALPPERAAAIKTSGGVKRQAGVLLPKVLPTVGA